MADKKVGHENKYVSRVARASRDSQKWLAGLIPGMQPIIDQAYQPYYPPLTEHNGQGDAMRHLLMQAGMTQEYGETPARVLSWLHENMSPGQPEAEYNMDMHNDALGRKLGGLGLSHEDLVNQAKQYVDGGQAKILMNTPQYASGGKVGCGCDQPSKHNATFMAGGLNILNPKNKTKGPLNVQWNSNNIIASNRAK